MIQSASVYKDQLVEKMLQTHTQTTPNTPAKGLRKLPLLLEELRLYVLQWHAADTQVLGGLIFMRVVAEVCWILKDRIVGCNGHEFRIASSDGPTCDPQHASTSEGVENGACDTHNC